MKSSQLNALLRQVTPEMLESLGLPKQAANEIAKAAPVFLTLLEQLERSNDARDKRERYRWAREQASLHAFRQLMAQRSPALLADPKFAKEIAGRSIDLGGAFAEAWGEVLEQLEAKEDELLSDAEQFFTGVPSSHHGNGQEAASA